MDLPDAGAAPAAEEGLPCSSCICRIWIDAATVSDATPFREICCCCGAGAACSEDGLRLRGLLAALMPLAQACRQFGPGKDAVFFKRHRVQHP